MHTHQINIRGINDPIAVDIINRILLARIALSQMGDYAVRVENIHRTISISIVTLDHEPWALACSARIGAVEGDVIIVFIPRLQEEACVIVCAADIALHKLCDIEVIIPVIRQRACIECHGGKRCASLGSIVHVEPVAAWAAPRRAVCPVLRVNRALVSGIRWVAPEQGEIGAGDFSGIPVHAQIEEQNIPLSACVRDVPDIDKGTAAENGIRGGFAQAVVVHWCWRRGSEVLKLFTVMVAGGHGIAKQRFNNV